MIPLHLVLGALEPRFENFLEYVLRHREQEGELRFECAEVEARALRFAIPKRDVLDATASIDEVTGDADVVE